MVRRRKHVEDTERPTYVSKELGRILRLLVGEAPFRCPIHDHTTISNTFVPANTYVRETAWTSLDNRPMVTNKNHVARMVVSN